MFYLNNIHMNKFIEVLFEQNIDLILTGSFAGVEHGYDFLHENSDIDFFVNIDMCNLNKLYKILKIKISNLKINDLIEYNSISIIIDNKQLQFIKYSNSSPHINYKNLILNNEYILKKKFNHIIKIISEKKYLESLFLLSQDDYNKKLKYKNLIIQYLNK